ncbi:MAG: hypothetical protein E7264_09250 [Lachnospiraceae bacterium]|nr:hypothetical protein [Lachnospiraceae bacterium]
MKRSMVFAIISLFVGVCLGIGVYSYHYFYPEKYIKTESGEYVLVEAMHASNTFPVTKDTQFVVEHYYTKDDRTLTEHVGNIPVLIGCDKKQLEEYLKTYMKDLSKEELALGLTTYQLVSYKDNEICLRKTYEKPKYEGYYAKSNNGTIVILNGDAKTVYEYTSISIHVLPEDLREEVKNGYYLEDENALYNFLETYSS